MNKVAALVMAGLVGGAGAWGQKAPVLAGKDVAAIAGEISGATAKRNLEGIAGFHRQRGSVGFHDAAVLVAAKLGFYGLSDVAILKYPTGEGIFYGTQRSRPAWDAETGELWELAKLESCPPTEEELKQAQQARKDGIGIAFDCVKSPPVRLLASFAEEPVVLAEDSESADVAADLVDVGAGTSESDYAGKDVKGKIVLVSAQPGAVQDLAVGTFGAVGIVSYAQNQKTAWWGENLDAIRWGHLETFSENKTFAFMVSLRTAHALQERLAKGEKIQLHAVVKAGQHPGYYEVVTATIPGTDEKLRNEEIAYSCHLDHQRPGANDNASGCATILEVARTLQHLIATGRLARPARTIRFIFPPEIEGTMALLNSKNYRTDKVDWPQYINVTGVEAGPPVKNPESPESGLGLPGGADWAKRVKAVVHMDMVGGGPETKAVFHVTRGPMSLPSFVQDVAWAFAEWVNEQTYLYAATGKAEFPLMEAEGGKEPLRAEYSAYTMGSDHDVYQDSSFGIPAIYLNDWPDRYIHTNLDTPANIDATKLKRVGLIGAASGYFLANPESVGTAKLLTTMRVGQLKREELRLQRKASVSAADNAAMQLPICLYEREIEINVFSQLRHYDAENEAPPPKPKECWTFYAPVGKLAPNMQEALQRKYRHKDEPKGPMAVFGYDYFAAEWAKRGNTTKPKLLEYEGLWGGGEEYAYEVLNFADGKRNAQEIRDAVSAEYGPVDIGLVVEYLKALEEMGVVERIEVKK